MQLQTEIVSFTIQFLKLLHNVPTLTNVAKIQDK
jgi:hypothetical protein